MLAIEMNAKRPFLRISLRELLFLVLLFAIVLSFLAAHLRSVYQQREIVARIREGGGRVEYDFEAREYGTYNVQEKIHPNYYRQWFGDDFVSDIYVASAPRDLDDNDAALLARLVELRELSLAGSRITDAGFARFRNHSHLQSLSLRSTAVTNDGLAALQNLHELRSLDLSQTQITDRGLANIQHLKQLEKLNLRYTSIGDEGISMLNEMTHLQTLDLGFTEVTDAALESLKKLKVLRVTNLEGTFVSLAGLNRVNESMPEHFRKVGFVAIPNADHRLAWREIDLAGGQVFSRMESDSTEVKWDVLLGRFRMITPRILLALGRLDNLDHLSLSGCVLDETARSHISKLRLRGISLTSIPLSEADYKFLRRMTDLETLAIIDCGTEDSDLGFLCEFKKLKNLVLNGKLSISPDTARLISTISTLELLGLERTEIDNQAIGQLSKCPNLQTLRLDGAIVDDVDLRSISGLTNLRQLFVRRTQVTSTGIAELQTALPQLKVECDR